MGMVEDAEDEEERAEVMTQAVLTQVNLLAFRQYLPLQAPEVDLPLQVREVNACYFSVMSLLDLTA